MRVTIAANAPTRNGSGPRWRARVGAWLGGALLALAVAGCGAAKVSSAQAPAPVVSLAGGTAVPAAVGPEAGEVPSIVHLPGGSWAMAYGSGQLGNRHIFFTTSPDGKSWAPAQPVDPGDNTDKDPVLFIAGNNLRLIFVSNRLVADWSLYETTLLDGAWTKAARILLRGSQVASPAVARTPSGWSMAYQCTDGLAITESHDGDNWAQPRIAGTYMGDPALCQVGDRLLLVAVANRKLQELWRDPQGTWSKPVTIAASGSCRQPFLAPVASDSALLAYGTQASDDAPFQLAVSRRQGNAWGPATTLTSAAFDAVNPSVFPDPDGSLALAWGIEPLSGSRGIYFGSRLTVPDASGSTRLSKTPAGG